MKTNKIQCLHPDGKSAPAIDANTFRLFETAITESLQDNVALTYSELMKKVEVFVAKHQPNFSGSVNWFGVVVNLHLEATKKIIALQEKGKKLHRLS